MDTRKFKPLRAERLYVERAPAWRKRPCEPSLRGLRAYTACALDGDADTLVSGDRHLLALGSYGSIEILTVDRFLESLDAED